MTLLDDLHRDQHDDLVLPSDHALTAYLAEAKLSDVLRDLAPTTEIEQRHLNRTKEAA